MSVEAGRSAPFRAGVPAPLPGKPGQLSPWVQLARSLLGCVPSWASTR